MQSFAGVLVVFLLLGFNLLSSFSFSDAEVAALDLARRPMGEAAASTDLDRSPAFLLLVRLLLSVGRPEELPVRAAFVLLGCAAVAWAWALARKTLPADFALLAAFLLALSPGVIAASRQVGPWAPGLFCATAALACLAHALRNVRVLASGAARDAERATRAWRHMAAGWAGFAAAAAAAAAIHPWAALLVLLGLVVAAPSCADRRAALGLGAAAVAVAVALGTSWDWAAAAWPAALVGGAAPEPIPRSATGDPVTGALAAFVALVRGESGAVPEFLVVPVGLVYFMSAALGFYRLWEAGDRPVRVTLAVVFFAHVAWVFLPGTHLRSAVFLAPGLAFATATGLMFLGTRLRAVALGLLLAAHLFSAHAFARGENLLDPSLREPHREVARWLTARMNPSDALVTTGDLAPFWFAFRERPVRHDLELRADGAFVVGRKDGSAESLLRALRYERRRFWLLARAPAEAARAGEFHLRLGVLVDWLGTQGRVLERRTFDTSAPVRKDPESGGPERAERIQLFLVDPLAR